MPPEDDEPYDPHDEHMNRHLEAAKAAAREANRDGAKVMGDAMGQMMESFAPVIAASNAVNEEVRAWDGFLVSAFDSIVRSPAPGGGAHKSVEVVATAAKVADVMLEERRKRFNVETIKARLAETLSTKEAQLVCGNMIGTSGVCARRTDHQGECSTKGDDDGTTNART